MENENGRDGREKTVEKRTLIGNARSDKTGYRIGTSRRGRPPQARTNVYCTYK